MSPAKLAELAAKFPEVAKQFNPKGPIYEDALLRAEKEYLAAAVQSKQYVVPEPTAAVPIQEPVMPVAPAAPITDAPATAPLIAVNLESPLAGALKQAARGIPQTPLFGKKPFQKDWQNKATTDVAQIQKWAEENPGCNFGSVAKGVIGGFWMLELDAPGEAARIRNETRNPIPITLLVRSRNGRGHLYWKQTAASIAMGNIGQDGVQGAGFSVRVNNEQCVSPGGIHPISGLPYTILDDAPIVEAPDWLIQWIEKQRQVVKKDPTKSLENILKEKLLIPEGERNTKLHKIGSKFRGAGVSEEGILEELHRVNEEQCDGDLPKEEIESIWRSVCGYPAGDPTKNPEDDIIINKTPNPLAGIQRAPATKGKAADYTPLEFKYPPTTDIESTGEDRDYVVGPPGGSKEGWFPRGHTSVIGGPSGGCKSTTMIDLLQAQKEREPFLGHTTYGMPYIIVQMDRGKRANRRTIDRMNLNEKSIPCCPIPVVWDDGAIHKLLEIIEACNPVPSIVFLEGMDMMVSEPHKLEKVAPFLSALNNIAEHYHIAIVGSVGSPKAKKGEGYAGGRDKIFGSVAWSRMTETVAMLQYIDGDDADARRSLVILLRNGPAEKFELKMGSNGRLEQVRPEAKSTVKKHLVWMEVQGDWWTVNDLATALQISVATAYRYVEDAYAKRLIRTKHKAAKFARLYQWNTAADKEQIEKSEKDAANFAQAKAEFEQAGILEKQEAREAARKLKEEELARKQDAARAKKYRQEQKQAAQAAKLAKSGKPRRPEAESGPTEP